MDSANVIGPGIRVKGTVKAEGSLHVAGRVDGSVEVAGRLVVAKGARLDARVAADEIEVDGQIRGTVTARKLLRVGGTGVVEGKVEAARLGVHPDARLVTELEMTLELPRGAEARRRR